MVTLSMGKTKEEALEFVGKEMPKGGVDNVASNVLKPITRKVAGDFPLIGSGSRTLHKLVSLVNTIFKH